MNKKRYSSIIKKTPFKYTISKKIAGLILEGFNRNEIYYKCFQDNYVEIDSMPRRREVTNVIYARLLELDRYLLGQFYNADIITSKFILVYAIAKGDSLFFDFMFEVYREALLGNKNYISIDDFELFFAAKKEADIVVSRWGNTTINQLARGYRNILVESGLGYRKKRNIVAVKAIIHPAVSEHIKFIQDEEYLKALLGEY
ncbi:MAG TPA: DUF1819 family protein [Clostridia bacterium]|jgi:hypothetical protein|nr:DUF1819 family protein [Clostridia bacterium]